MNIRDRLLRLRVWGGQWQPYTHKLGKTALSTGHGAYDGRKREISVDDYIEGPMLRRPSGAHR